LTVRERGHRISSRMVKTRRIPVVAVVGEDDYLKNEEIRAAVGEVQSEGVEVAEYDAGETPLATILDEVRTYPFLHSHRVVVVRNADILLPDAEKSLLRCLENPTDFSTLILDFTSLDGRSKLARAVKTQGREVRVQRMREYQVPQWLVARAQNTYGKRLTEEDARFIVEMAGTDPGLLDSELAKVASLNPEARTIERGQIESIITRGRAQTVFKLTEQVEAKRRPEALKLLEDILSQGIYDERAGTVTTEGAGIVTYLLHMLNWSITRLWTANRLLSQQKSDEEVASELKLHPRFARQFLDNLRKSWPRSECRRCLRELLLADRRVKSSGGEPSAVLESLIAGICS
jgi:DNA polymerase-3 subunit delta